MNKKDKIRAIMVVLCVVAFFVNDCIEERRETPFCGEPSPV